MGFLGHCDPELLLSNNFERFSPEKREEERRGFTVVVLKSPLFIFRYELDLSHRHFITLPEFYNKLKEDD